MHPIVEGYLDKPNSHKIGIWFAALALLGFIFWTYFYKSLHNEKLELKEKIADLQVKKIEEQRIANNLPRFREETKKYDKLLERVLLELPDKKEIRNLLNSVSVLAVDTGLEVTKFTPGREQIRDFVVSIPVNVELEGSFHQLVTFFDEVGQLARIVNIDEISVDIITESPVEVVVRASCKATAFRYLDESEQVKQPGKGKGKKGRKHRKT